MQDLSVFKRIAQNEIVTEHDFARLNGSADAARRFHAAKREGLPDHKLGEILAQSGLSADEIGQIFGNVEVEKPHLLTLLGADLYDKQYPPRQFLIDGLIQRGNFVVLAGRPKSGKSWLTLQLAQAIDQGQPFLGRATTKARVLLLALEDGQRRVHERLHVRKWKPQNTLIAFDCLPFDDQRGDPGPGLEQLFNTIRESRAEIVVVDTLRKALSGKSDESNNAEMAAILYRLADFAHENSVAILLTHHTTKTNTDDPFNSVRGAGAIRGSYDMGIVLQRDPKEKEAILHVESRDVEVEAMTITFDKSGGWTYSGDGAEIEKLRGGRKAIKALQEMGDWQTLKDIATQMGVTEQAAGQQLRALLEKGHVKRKNLDTPVKTGGRPVELWSL